ncbi:MAG: T9SS type A sorting domain-containing protein [Saprospiraceae bacterium]|nr:T9SS type A sorting domain-containing protein [Saprospiraceae bacterium]
MYKVFISILTLLSFTSNAQIKGDYVWIGGVQTNPDGGQKGHTMDFLRNKGEPAYVNIPKGFTGNNASICDENGYLMFYFNGCAVMNRYHHIMPNGDSINAGSWFDLYWKDCKYGYPGSQNCLILKDKSNEYGYYIIYSQVIYFPGVTDSVAMFYSYVDMSSDNGNGDVIIKNVRIYDKLDMILSYTTAISNEANEGWWLLQPIIGNEFITYYLGSNGLERFENQESSLNFTRDYSSSAGTAKFSPDGKKLALYNYNDQLHIYDFDRSTGLISGHQKVEIYPQDSIDRSLLNFASVEWSPNSRYIYCASYLKLHQFDTWESNPQEGVRHIADYNGTLDPFPTELFLMAQGPDCKIYMTPKNGSYSLHVINKPDELGKACDFVQNAIKLPNSNSGTLPNFPRFRVDEDKKCDPTITSLFGETVYYRREIEVFPNPSNGVFQIKIPEVHRSGTFIVSNTEGKTLVQKQVNWSVLEEIDISTFPSGRYNIEFYPDDQHEKIYYGKQVIKI